MARPPRAVQRKRWNLILPDCGSAHVKCFTASSAAAPAHDPVAETSDHTGEKFSIRAEAGHPHNAMGCVERHQRELLSVPEGDDCPSIVDR